MKKEERRKKKEERRMSPVDMDDICRMKDFDLCISELSM
jgi:hypothetical protein